LCHFYTLNPTNFAQIYCFTIFIQILLKFHDIEKQSRKKKDRFCDELYKYICNVILFIKFLEINYASHFTIINIIKKIQKNISTNIFHHWKCLKKWGIVLGLGHIFIILKIVNLIYWQCSTFPHAQTYKTLQNLKHNKCGMFLLILT